MCGIPTPPWRILYSLLSYNNCGCLAFCDSNFTATSWKWQKYNISPHFTAPVTRVSPITAQINDKFEHRVAASDVQHLTSWEFASPFAFNTLDLTLKIFDKNIDQCGRLHSMLPLRSLCWWPGICHRKIPIRFFWQACIFHRQWIRF